MNCIFCLKVCKIPLQRASWDKNVERALERYLEKKLSVFSVEKHSTGVQKSFNFFEETKSEIESIKKQFGAEP